MLRAYVYVFLLLIPVHSVDASAWPQNHGGIIADKEVETLGIESFDGNYCDNPVFESNLPRVNNSNHHKVDNKTIRVEDFLEEYKSLGSSRQSSLTDFSNDISHFRTAHVHDPLLDQDRSVTSFLEEYRSRQQSRKPSACQSRALSRQPSLAGGTDLFPLTPTASNVRDQELEQYASRVDNNCTLPIADSFENASIKESMTVYPRHFCHFSAVGLASRIAHHICWENYSEEEGQQDTLQDAVDTKRWWEDFACNWTDDDRTSLVEEAVAGMTPHEQKFYQTCCNARCKKILLDNVLYHMAKELNDRYPSMYPQREYFNKERNF